jgi:hypothetical protein
MPRKLYQKCHSRIPSQVKMLFIFPALPCMFKARVELRAKIKEEEEKLQHPPPPSSPLLRPSLVPMAIPEKE